MVSAYIHSWRNAEFQFETSENKDGTFHYPSLELFWILGMDHAKTPWTGTIWFCLSPAHHHRERPTWLIQRQALHSTYSRVGTREQGYPPTPAPLMHRRLLLTVLVAQAFMHLQPYLLSRDKVIITAPTNWALTLCWWLLYEAKIYAHDSINTIPQGGSVLLWETEAERLKDHWLAPGGKQALNSVVPVRTPLWTLHAFVPGTGTGPVTITV